MLTVYFVVPSHTSVHSNALIPIKSDLAIPRLLPFAFGDEPSYLADSTSVQCTLSSGDLPATFSWYLNKQPVQTYGGINVIAVGKKTSLLSIDSLSEEHAGNYTCLAQNAAGSVSYTSELIVKGIFVVLCYAFDPTLLPLPSRF